MRDELDATYSPAPSGFSSHTRRITYSLRSNASWSSVCFRSGADEQLADHGATRAGDLAGVLRRHRHLPPAEHRLALLAHRPFEQAFQARAMQSSPAGKKHISTP